MKTVSLDFIKGVEESFRRSHGDRLAAPNCGTCLMVGKHYKARVKDRPETEPGKRILDNFSRASDKEIHQISSEEEVCDEGHIEGIEENH